MAKTLEPDAQDVLEELPEVPNQEETEETAPEGADIAQTVKSTTISLSQKDIDNQKAQAVRESRKLPPTPGLSPSLEQLDEWLKLLTDAHWSHVTVYLYRKYPAIVRQLANPDANKYIDVLSKMSIEEGLINYIKSRHGGGKYKIWATDLDKKSGKGNEKIIETSFTIDYNETPPILDLKEVDVNNKINMGFINQMTSKGLMDGKGNVVQPQGTVSQGNSAETVGAVGNIMREFMGMYSQLNKDSQSTINKILADGSNKKDDGGVQQLLLEKLKQDDPNKTTATMISLISAMKEMVPKQDNAMFQMIITMVQENSSRQMEMMKMMFDGLKATTPTENNGESKGEDFFDKFLRYREAMPELFGGRSNTPKRETAEIIMDGAKEFLMPLIGIGSQLLQLKTGAKPIVPITESQAMEFVNNNPSQPQPRQNVLPMPSPTQPNQTNQPNQPNPTPGQPGQSILDMNNLTVSQKLIMQFGGMLITAIKAGKTGGEMADALESSKILIGDIYGMLKSQGKEEILHAMESLDEFWNQTGKVYGKPYMEQLIDDFLSDPPEDDEEITEEDNGKKVN